MLSDDQMYQGFTPEQVKQYRKEVAEKWGEKSLHGSENRVRKMSPKEWAAVKMRGEEIVKKLASLMDKDPASKPVQQAIADWHKHLENFVSPASEQYLRGLGKMYVEDARFTAYYEKYRKGLAEFKNRAIQIYCDNGMKVG